MGEYYQQDGFESSPQFLQDGTIIYSANYTGVSNIYHLNLEQQTISQRTSIVGGAFESMWQSELGLVCQSYGEKSYKLRHIKSPEPITMFTLSNPRYIDTKSPLFNHNKLDEHDSDKVNEFPKPTPY